MSAIVVRPLIASDRQWAERIVSDLWGTTTIVVHETVYHPAQLPGFVAGILGSQIQFRDRICARILWKKTGSTPEIFRCTSLFVILLPLQ